MLKGKRFKLTFLVKRLIVICLPIFFCFILIFYSLGISLPSLRSPIRFYFTHNRDDLKLVLIRAIKKSCKSIHLRTYALTDLSILSLLKQRAQDGIEVHLYYHKKSSPKLERLEGPCFHLHPVQGKGLMHEKIWIIDECQSFLGSTNITYSSLKIHENGMIGIYSPQFARSLIHCQNKEIVQQINGQTIHYFPFPNPTALDNLLTILDRAQKRVDLFLFTFTHSRIVQKLIDLHERGVHIHLTIDAYTARSSSKRALTMLVQAGIPVYLSQGIPLFHHKWALIDQHTLVFGSANWTRAAFTKNRDFLLVLYPLKGRQIKCLHHVIHKIRRYNNGLFFGS